MHVVDIADRKELWQVRVQYENGAVISLSDVVGVDTDDVDMVKVYQDNGDYLLVFYSGRPQFMEVVQV